MSDSLLTLFKIILTKKFHKHFWLSKTATEHLIDEITIQLDDKRL